MQDWKMTDELAVGGICRTENYGLKICGLGFGGPEFGELENDGLQVVNF